MEKDPEQLAVYGLKIIRRILGLKKRKLQIKYFEKNLTVLFVDQINQDLKKKK